MSSMHVLRLSLSLVGRFPNFVLVSFAVGMFVGLIRGSPLDGFNSAQLVALLFVCWCRKEESFLVAVVEKQGQALSSNKRLCTSALRNTQRLRKKKENSNNAQGSGFRMLF